MNLLQPAGNGKFNRIGGMAPEEKDGGEHENTGSPVKPETLQSIRKILLAQLGRPKNLKNVEIKPISKNKYRVNTVVEVFEEQSMFPSITRPHSYYVIDKGNDEAFEFYPPVVKTYDPR